MVPSAHLEGPSQRASHVCAHCHARSQTPSGPFQEGGCREVLERGEGSRATRKALLGELPASPWALLPGPAVALPPAACPLGSWPHPGLPHRCPSVSEEWTGSPETSSRSGLAAESRSHGCMLSTVPFVTEGSAEANENNKACWRRPFAAAPSLCRCSPPGRGTLLVLLEPPGRSQPPAPPPTEGRCLRLGLRRTCSFSFLCYR